MREFRRRRRGWTSFAIHLNWQTDDDPARVLLFGDLGEPVGQGGGRLRRDRGQAGGDGPGRVADSETDALGPRVHRQDPQGYGEALGEGDGAGAGAVLGGAFCSTT